MTLPHIWLSSNNITNFKGGRITQYLIFEGFDVVMQVTLLADMDVSSMVEPTDGVWLRM
jgi:hypothetical protein